MRTIFSDSKDYLLQIKALKMSKSSRFNYLKSHIMSKNPNTLAKKILPEATLQKSYKIQVFYS